MLIFAFPLFANEKIGVSTQVSESVTTSSESFTNFVGSSTVGFGTGIIASLGLLAKDKIFGVVIKGGPEFWGRDTVLPLTCLVLASTS
jgi:hypothetical protein